MRNLTFLTAPSTEPAARCFRRAFMGKTATWSVGVAVCASRAEGARVLEGKEHAFAASPAFRGALYSAATVKGASARLSGGADVLYRAERGPIALAQLARSVVDALEEAFLPIHGARVAVLGSGSAALDAAYECSRAGVDEVVLLGRDKARTQEALSSFLDEFFRSRTGIIDADQAREGHLSALRAYEHTDFLFGAVNGPVRLSQADVVINLMSRLPDEALAALNDSQIVCDPWGLCPAFDEAARVAGCDVLPSDAAMARWGTAAADVLVEFGRGML